MVIILFLIILLISLIYFSRLFIFIFLFFRGISLFENKLVCKNNGVNVKNLDEK
jgi:hypothetical protein